MIYKEKIIEISVAEYMSSIELLFLIFSKLKKDELMLNDLLNANRGINKITKNRILKVIRFILIKLLPKIDVIKEKFL